MRSAARGIVVGGDDGPREDGITAEAAAETIHGLVERPGLIRLVGLGILEKGQLPGLCIFHQVG